MSSFFGKDQAQKNLQYDDIAFIHFLISVCSGVALVMLILILTDICQRKRFPIKKLKAAGIFQKQLNNQSKKGDGYIGSQSFTLKFIIFAVMASIAIICAISVSSQSNKMIGFDPHQILGVSYDATSSQIKKSYRKLALEFHPDRNPNNPEAGAKFIMISKAYQCLTDQKAKQNCLKYGNPDGQQSFKVGIGLPSFVINMQHQMFVLPVVFGLLLFVIPFLFIRWNNTLRAKDDNGLSLLNYPLLYRFFSSDFMTSDIIIMFACLREVTDYNVKITDTEAKQTLKKLQQYKDFINYKDLTTLQACCLPTILRLAQHLTLKRCDYELAKLFQQQYGKLIQFSLIYCKKSNHGKYLIKNQQWPLRFLNTGILRMMVQFQRRFYFCLFTSPMQTALELLDLNPQQIQKVRQNPIHNIQEEILESEQRMDKFVNDFSQNRRDYIKRQLKNWPLLELKTKLFIGDQQVQKMTTGDRATIKFIIRKLNKTTNYCSIKTYPFLKKQKYYYMLTYNGNLIHFKQFHFQDDKDQYIGQFPYDQQFPRAVDFVSRVVSDTYFGLDTDMRFVVNVVEQNTHQDIIFHKDDLEIQKMPKTFLESVFSLEIQADSEKAISDGEQDDQNFTVLNKPVQRKTRTMMMEEEEQHKCNGEHDHGHNHGHNHGHSHNGNGHGHVHGQSCNH